MDKITLKDIELRLASIRVAAKYGDDEDAHGQEDALWADVLYTIAHGVAEPRFAAAALQSRKIRFRRDCA